MNKRILKTAFSFIVISMLLAAGKLEYLGEDVSIVIDEDGGAEIIVTIREIGSLHNQNFERKEDLAIVKDIARSDKFKEDAAEKGVDITIRRLDYINFSVNGYVEAKARKLQNIFDVYTLHKLEITEKYIFITPTQETLLRAELSAPGKLTSRNGRVSFQWPKGTSKLSFKTEYRQSGASFRYDFQKGSGSN